jgi:hypothetical protein
MSIAVNPENQPLYLHYLHYLHCSSATRVAAVWMASQVQRNGATLSATSATGSGIAGRPEDALQLARALLPGERGR